MSDDQPSNSPAVSDTSFLMAEYQTLRAELASRTKTQNHLVLLAFAVFVALITFAAGSLLLYPLLALYFALLWLAQERAIAQIGRYIEEKIEPVLLADGAGWEKYRRALPHAEKALPLALSSRGVFVGTQVIALAISALNILSGFFNPSYAVAAIVFGATWLAQAVVFGAALWATKLTYEFMSIDENTKTSAPVVKLEEQGKDEAQRSSTIVAVDKSNE